MASNYNHLLRPPVVAVRDGVATVVVRRETEEDLLRTDMGTDMGTDVGTAANGGVAR
jgi:diaminopimelate decarboxylase